MIRDDEELSREDESLSFCIFANGSREVTLQMDVEVDPTGGEWIGSCGASLTLDEAQQVAEMLTEAVAQAARGD